jgi:signal peptidase
MGRIPGLDESSKVKKATEHFGFTLAIALMLASVLTYLAPHFGWRVDAVVSGSMEPSLTVGSLVVTRPVDPEAIIAGDIITFKPAAADETPITHRVIYIERNSPLSFITKGDANDRHDPFSVLARNVMGKICFHLPYAGYVTEFLKTPRGYFLGLAIPSLFVITMYVRSIWRVLGKRKTVEAANV